jgi:hypothetical protein
MNSIDWKAKFGSRKFWAMLAALVGGMTTYGLSEELAVQIVALIGAFGGLCVYMLSESSVDKAKYSQPKADYQGLASAIGFAIDSIEDEDEE